MTHDVYILSDVGRVRQHNEDDALVLMDEQLYIVADGMGGHACGEVASHIAVQSVREFYTDPAFEHHSRSLYKELKGSEELDGIASFQQYYLSRAIEYGNRQIYEHAAGDDRFSDMGTTVVGLAFSGNRVYVAHVGDSRAYRMRSGGLEQLTEDHSLANEFIRLNVLKPEDLPHFPHKNVIVRALGLQNGVKVDSAYRTAREGDRFLLCSDGLSDLLSDEEIAEVLEQASCSRHAAERLVDLALDYGGVDNITVLIVDLLPNEA